MNFETIINDMKARQIVNLPIIKQLVDTDKLPYNKEFVLLLFNYGVDRTSSDKKLIIEILTIYVNRIIRYNLESFDNVVLDVAILILFSLHSRDDELQIDVFNNYVDDMISCVYNNYDIETCGNEMLSNLQDYDELNYFVHQHEEIYNVYKSNNTIIADIRKVLSSNMMNITNEDELIEGDILLSQLKLVLCNNVLDKSYDMENLYILRPIYTFIDSYTHNDTYTKGIISSILNSIDRDTRAYTAEINKIMTILLPIIITKQLPSCESVEYFVGMEASILSKSRGRSNLSKNVDKASRKVYRGYKAYKDEEDKIDSQLGKLITSLKERARGNAQDEIINGKQFSPIRILKKILGTAAIYSVNKFAAVLFVITSFYKKKGHRTAERKEMISVVQAELEILEEKIEDAKGDSNRQAKYAMMRTRSELKKFLHNLKHGLAADERSMKTGKALIRGKQVSPADNYADNNGRDDDD